MGNENISTCWICKGTGVVTPTNGEYEQCFLCFGSGVITPEQDQESENDPVGYAVRHFAGEQGLSILSIVDMGDLILVEFDGKTAEFDGETLEFFKWRN